MKDLLNKIHCGDCNELIKLLPDECIDLTVTSPPYDNLRIYDEYQWDFEKLAKDLFRVTKNGGVVVWVVGDATINGSETGTSFKQALYFKKIGFNLHDTMIYKSAKPPLTHNRYEQVFEFMFILSKNKPKTFNPIMKKNKYVGQNVLRNGNWESKKQNSCWRQREGKKECKEFGIMNNIWEYKTGGKHTTIDKIAYEHPAVFPEKLAADHIVSWSNEGDIILDPFSGSGTTIKMAIELKRQYIGFEISQKYVELSLKRIEPYLTQGKLF